ncbi:MAG TPA: hypothetical protein VMT23_03215 [Candidatus Binatia bacterium]|nr:hypothetical protein [Candidatus Binatia bacterium]
MSATTTTTTNPKAVIAFIAVFAAFIALFIGLYIRRREVVFTGTVIDKNILESVAQNSTMPMNQGGITFGGGRLGVGNNSGVIHNYQIRVKTDAGKEFNYPISSGKYEIIKIGDRVSKPKGTTEVDIISAATPANQAGPSAPPPSTAPPTTPPQGPFV